MADNPKTNPMNDEDPKSRKDSRIPDRQKVTRQVATVGVGGNIFLAAFKLFAGIFGNSTAMISDAVHSLSDVFATAIAFVGVRLAERRRQRPPLWTRTVRKRCIPCFGSDSFVHGLGNRILQFGEHCDRVVSRYRHAEPHCSHRGNCIYRRKGRDVLVYPPLGARHKLECIHGRRMAPSL